MKKCRSSIFCDIDNTIADTCSVIEGIFGPMPNPLDLFHPNTPFLFWFIPNKKAKAIFSSAKPIPFARESLSILAKNQEIIYLTARPKWSKSLTKHWLRKNKFPPGKIIHSFQKNNYVSKNSIVLEDDPKQIKKIKKIAQVYVHKRTWNKDLENTFVWRDVFYGRSIIRSIT